jgi:hypothetical protein
MTSKSLTTTTNNKPNIDIPLVRPEGGWNLRYVTPSPGEMPRIRICIRWAVPDMSAAQAVSYVPGPYPHPPFLAINYPFS